MPALGEEFRSAREARGLTLSDVAEAIHIRSVYLNAIEQDDWPAIGAPVYVRGFLRTYARFLGLDAEAAVARFNELAPPERPAASVASAVDTTPRGGPSIWVAVGTIVALLLVGFVGWEWWQYAHGANEGAVAEATAAPQPTAAPAESGASAPAGAAPSAAPSARVAPPVAHRLALTVVERSWVRVTVDGTTRLEGIFPAGTARSFTGTAADVRAGNAAGVTVSVDGRRPVHMGGTGDVVERHFTL